MKGWWKIVLGMAVPLVRGAGLAKENEDANNTGQDDLIGIALVFMADLGQWALDGGIGKPPTVPQVLK